MSVQTEKCNGVTVGVQYDEHFVRNTAAILLQEKIQKEQLREKWFARETVEKLKVLKTPTVSQSMVQAVVDEK